MDTIGDDSISIIDTLPFIGQDERVRKYLLPEKVVITEGSVTDAGKLLVQKSKQIGLYEPEITVLRNDDSGENASVLLDYGVEMHGGIRILAAFNQADNAPQVRVTFGESVTEAMSRIGTKNATNDHSVRDMVVTVPALSDQMWGETGFRFVRIELLSPNAILQLKSVIAVFVYRELPYLGSFRCDDKVLNQIYDTAAYTCHLNMQNLLWDGIKRDRLVWIGDMHPEMLAIRSLFGAHHLVEESLDFVREQTLLPSWMNKIPSYSMWWILVLWDWYWYTGDATYVIKQQDYICSLLEQMCAMINEDGTVELTEDFFDWPTRYTPSAVSGVRSVLRLALDTGVKLTGLFHHQSLSESCMKKRKLLDLQIENHQNFKQTAAFLALSHAMDFQEAGRMILKDGTTGLSTFLCYYMLKVADLAGYTAEALGLLKDYYGSMLQKGATTFWEDFHTEWMQNSGSINQTPDHNQSDLHGDFGDFCYTGFRHSFCHGWASGPVPFLAEQILGIRIEAAGCRRLSVKPHLGDLKWAQGAYPTPHGLVTVSHTRDENGTIRTTFDAPDEVDVIVISEDVNR